MHTADRRAPGSAAEPQRFDRFEAWSVLWFLRAFGLALVLDVASELAAGVWAVHTGHLYPWRHLGIVPLYPAWTLALEWTLRVACGAALVVGTRRAAIVAMAIKVGAAVLFVALLQRYSNHGVLLFLIAFFLTLAPPDLTAPSFDEAPHHALGLVRAQLVIVYVFSALNKLVHGFASGGSLVNLLATVGISLGAGLARAMSWAVILTELALPLLLVRWPRVGFVGVVALHVTFAALLPNVASFGLAMIAMAMLFLRRRA